MSAGVPAHLETSRTSGGEAPGGGGSCSHIHHWRWLSRTWGRPAGWERGGAARGLWLTFRSPADREVPSPTRAEAGGGVGGAVGGSGPGPTGTAPLTAYED